MSEKPETQEIEKARKSVSGIIFKTIANNISVNNALQLFPKDIQDASIDCAWHALIHLEADEDMRAQDKDYAKEQNEYLEMMAFMLQEGKELPENIINSYNKYYEKALTPKSKSVKNFFKNLFQFITLK